MVEGGGCSGWGQWAWAARLTVATWPDYADYQAKTHRQIPVFVLTPVK